MDHLIRRFCFVLSMLGLIACEPDLEEASFNAYFYYPNETEVHLGVVTGLSARQKSANNYAISHNLERTDWSYVCCRRTSSSECASKHK